jgi:TonB family protein
VNTSNTRKAERKDWRWLLIVLGLTALQAGVVWGLSLRPPASGVTHPLVPEVRVVPGDLTKRLADPLMLALPTSRGFAGLGWRRAKDPEYVAQDWTEPMPWRGQSETDLAQTMLAAPNVGVGRGMTVDKPLPQLARMALPEVRLAGETVVRLAGASPGWDWVEPLTAPAVTHSNVLNETVVQVTLDRWGQVFSQVVLRSSGHKPADQQALALAGSARFRRTVEPADDEEWGWARLVFEWRTIAPGWVAAEGRERGP